MKLECDYDHGPSKSPTPEHPSGLSPYGARETDEIVAVRNFTTVLGPELAGCFSDQVWCSILPRIAQHETAIWDSLVAVSMLDNCMRLGRNIGPAIRQYDKAIQGVRLRMTSSEESHRIVQDVVLLSCLLFTVFECLQNGILNALNHVVAGMKLLRQWAPNEAVDSQKAYLSRSTLEPIFLVLDSQAIQMAPIGFRDQGDLPSVDQPQRPQYVSFETMEDAHFALNRIFNRISHWAHWAPPSVSLAPSPSDSWLTMEKQLIRNQLEEWDQAFRPLSNPSDARNLLPLLQRTVTQIFFERFADELSEMEWDKYLPQFRVAVQYAEAYMRVAGPSTASTVSETGQRRPFFTTSMDIVLPLFLVSTRCRDSDIRRRALTMLKMCDRREGLWNSSSCGKVAERIIELEERSALQDGSIPSACRISEIDVGLGEDGVYGIVYKREPVEGDTSDSVVIAHDEVN